MALLKLSMAQAPQAVKSVGDVAAVTTASAVTINIWVQYLSVTVAIVAGLLAATLSAIRLYDIWRERKNGGNK